MYNDEKTNIEVWVISIIKSWELIEIKNWVTVPLATYQFFFLSNIKIMFIVINVYNY